MSAVIEKPGVMLARGVCRLMGELGFATLTEFPVRTGRRMDVCALGPRGEIWCVEVKSSRADFQADAKWPEYLDWCDRLFFAVPDSFPEDILPWDHGLIRADGWGGAILREAPEEGLAAARRKAILLRFARLAAERLSRAAQPAVGMQP
ncbi:MAG: MmcB family DNA repair protein [Pseudomonadota bacterium]